MSLLKLMVYATCLFFLMQNKLQDLTGKHSDVLENLSPVVRKRVEVLRGLQACDLISNTVNYKYMGI